jgi:hypothetical protein
MLGRSGSAAVVNAYIPVQSEIRPDYAQRLRDEQT